MSDAKCVIYVKNAIFDIYANLKRSIISRKQYLPNKLCMKKSCFASLKTRLVFLLLVEGCKSFFFQSIRGCQSVFSQPLLCFPDDI